MIEGRTSDLAPQRARVVERIEHDADMATLWLVGIDAPIPVAHAGQFFMLWGFGVGEIPISISHLDPAHGEIGCTIRAVGAVSRAIEHFAPGAMVGLRGPFGNGWSPPGRRHVVIVGGGLGVAPLRPLIVDLSSRTTDVERLDVVVGARRPEEILFRSELSAIASGHTHVAMTVDRPAPEWTGAVGLVTEALSTIAVGPDTEAYVCGPEVMMRTVADALVSRGVPAQAVQVSLERNMHCAVGRCGHCQLGTEIICRDGPVFTYAAVRELLKVREL